MDKKAHYSRRKQIESMSELSGSERRQLRGEFARAFLRAARYDDFEIGLLGDLSRVSPEQVEAMLNAKLEEMKLLEDAVKHPWEFKGLGGASKNKE